MTSPDQVTWPKQDFSRVPFHVFADQEVFDREQTNVFHGPVWCYLALEAELAQPGDYVNTFLGNTGVVVTRAEDGEIHGWINRCAHRGTTIVRDMDGNAKDFTCIYHHWCYDLKGNLIGVPFERGMNGEGGMPDDFDKADHGLTKINIASYRGVIFGSMHFDLEPLEEYLDAPMRGFLDQLFCKPVEILGYTRQRMPSNWKFYYENLNDNYHAGLLHQFQTTFGIFRNTQEGGQVMDKFRRHTISYSVMDSDDAAAIEEGYGDIGIYDESLKLEDSTLVDFRDEEGNRRAINMMVIFPSVLFQRLSNTLATRQIRPKGPDEFELYWTVFGYQDDDAELRAMRMKQSNMLGPGGLISMEDGESGVLGQRAVTGYRDGFSVIRMGGDGPIGDQETLLTEVPIRGFWRYYCHLMGFPVEGGLPWPPKK